MNSPPNEDAHELRATAAAFDLIGAMSIFELTAQFGPPDGEYHFKDCRWSSWADLEILTIDGTVHSQLLESFRHLPRSRLLDPASVTWISRIDSADDLITKALGSELPHTFWRSPKDAESIDVHFASGFTVSIRDGVVVCSWTRLDSAD